MILPVSDFLAPLCEFPSEAGKPMIPFLQKKIILRKFSNCSKIFPRQYFLDRIFVSESYGSNSFISGVFRPC